MKKICYKCNSNKIVKNGKRQGKQRFLCKLCGYIFEHGKGKNNKIGDFEEKFESYVRDDLKYRQMSQTLDLSIRSVQRIIDAAPFKKTIVIL